jgi:dephospho-CoA kinase
VKLVGLTGGIGSGKSTVSGLLAQRGAVIVDADLVAREVQAPGSEVLAALAERFGGHVIAADGSLDRPAVAAIVFNDPDALQALNRIVHPAIGVEINRRVNAAVATDRIVILDVPLLTEQPRVGLQGIIVVDVPVELQVARLVQFRGFDEADARARISRQATREQRLATATKVVDNSGALDDLLPQIDDLWRWLADLPQLPDDFEFGAKPPAPPATPE